MRENMASDRDRSPMLPAEDAEPLTEKTRDEGELPSVESLRSSLLDSGILCDDQVLEGIEISPTVFCNLFLEYSTTSRPLSISMLT